jgi:hypothetical protein
MISQKFAEIKPFSWSPNSEKAAQLVAEDRLTNEKIAQTCGVTRRTLDNWKTHPEFAERVEQCLAEFRAVVRKRGIAILENRVDRLHDRWNKLHQIIEERALEAEMQTVPGGKTGMITRNLKGIGKGEDYERVEVFEVDTALLAEIRNHEQQAAKELGQWVERSNVEVRNTDPLESLKRRLLPPTGAEGDTGASGESATE